MELVEVEAWRRWAVSRRGAERRRGWARRHRSLAGWGADELASPVSGHRTDRMQRDLVALAQSGDGEAALTLLVQFRPGLIRLVRWVVARGWFGQQEAGDEVRAAFYETLCRHRLDRRPARIAANLLLDTRQRLYRAGVRDARSPPVGPHDLDRLRVPDDRPGPDPADGLALRLAVGEALAELPGSSRSRNLTARAAYRAWILDQPRAVIAAELGLGPAAVSTRLHRLRSAVSVRVAAAA